MYGKAECEAFVSRQGVAESPLLVRSVFLVSLSLFRGYVNESVSGGFRYLMRSPSGVARAGEIEYHDELVFLWGGLWL